MNVKKKLKNIYWFCKLYHMVRYEIPARLLGDEKMIKKQFLERYGFVPNLKNPKTLAEKIQWIKLNDRQSFNTLAADKYRIRKFYEETFGKEYVVPLIKKFDSWRDVVLDALPDEPFIIKANTGTSTWQIVRNKKNLDIEDLRLKCRKWMFLNHYYTSQEWQYKNIKPCIIVEKLLTDEKGRVPKDYKLHYINGKLQFIYCVADREGNAYRAMFSPGWKLLPFQWVSVKNHSPIKTEVDEPKPVNLEKMIVFGNEIAKKFKYYVRVDFYEVCGKLYFGEITMHHGSGMNMFFPPKAEKEFADKMVL